MADIIKRGAAWLGLVPDTRYDEEEDDLTGQVYGEATEEVSVPSSNVTSMDQRRPVVVPDPRTPADVTRIITVHPRVFNEAATIGEHFRDGVPVIMNLTEMDDPEARRLVDFASGLTYGLRGTFERVTRSVFLLSPQNVNVTAEEKQRIAGGFYNQS